MSTRVMPPIMTTAADLVSSELDAAMPAAQAEPARLHAAMRYAIEAGGKRVRPALVLAACRAAGGTDQAALPAMAAVELLHTYTLVHDDLPAMDDDALRRGRPTVHVAYDEATAILVGDALQCLAFEVLAEVSGAAVACLAHAAGSVGVVGGQQDDLDAEGQPVDASAACQARLERIHRGKTAALIRASCELGAICAGCAADDPKRRHLAAFGEAIGLAFQVADDVLDVTAEAEALGKTPGKDAASGKLTWVAVHGLEAAQAEAERLRSEANAQLAELGSAGADLQAIARFIVDRNW